MRAARLVLASLAVASAVSCTVDTAPDGLRATPPGSGPRVVFDVTRRPLPAIPFPNDTATFADPTSRTGRRVNASLAAHTAMERKAREGFAEMEGWGTFAPITVEFERPLDVGLVARTMRDDGFEPANDPVYVVNLTTGVPVLLDMGHGNYPVVVRDLDRYYPNDPKAREQTLLFETVEEGAGLSQADYRPALDMDFDGVLDHPNTFVTPGAGVARPGVDDLLTFYERQTSTLILRPMLPMEEKTEYAVVLTDRLRGEDGEPVRSPFPFVHHPQQRSGLQRLEQILRGGGRASYYGDLDGTGLEHVAFAWTFTTQPTTEDMRLLRDGLHGKGPFARFAAEFPPDLMLYRAAGKYPRSEDDPPGWEDDPQCREVAKRPYTVKFTDIADTLTVVAEQFFGFEGSQVDALKETLSNVDHLVIGSYRSPHLNGDPRVLDPDAHFRVNFKTGEAEVHSEDVKFWIAIPKATPAHRQPFPVAFWAHGTTLHAAETLIHAGHLARQGVAVMGIDMPGHGLALDPGQARLAGAYLGTRCLAPAVVGVVAGRARDLNGDGKLDSGGDLWTPHVFRTRDNVRQSVLDVMQGLRVLRAFDGQRRANQDYDADGEPDVAGDFDGDGVPDLGGPAVAYSMGGGSYGGIVAMVAGALDPQMKAVAPISGAGGMTDVAVRSFGVVDSVIEKVISPIVVAVPAASRPPEDGAPRTRCTGTQRSVRFVVNDLLQSKELEIACLDAGELDRGMTVVVTNVASKERRCARTGDDGRFRLSLPATRGDRIDVQVYLEPDVVDSYDEHACNVRPGAPVGRRIAEWEQEAARYEPVASEDRRCESARGCAQFRDTFYAVGAPLVAPQDGWGLSRQSPEFRRVIHLTQAVVDPADPVNFAAYYMLRGMPDPDGRPAPPRALLNIATVGDAFVSIAASQTLSRAAGALPFLPPDAARRLPEYADWATPAPLWRQLGGKTPADVLHERFVTEGIARLARTPAGAACGVNYVPGPTCTASPRADAETCRDTLADPDWLDEGRAGDDQQHPPVPLRLARLAGLRVTDDASLDAAWAPRLASTPLGPDGAGYVPAPGAPLVATLTAYTNPLGSHVWLIGDPCKKWDDVTYFEGLYARFFATAGTELPYLSAPASHHCLQDASCAFQR